MKRALPSPFDSKKDFIIKQVSVHEVEDDIEFYEMVRRINNDCLSTAGEISLYYKSQLISQIKKQNQSVVHGLLEDITHDVMTRVQTNIHDCKEKSDFQDIILEKNNKIETLFMDYLNLDDRHSVLIDAYDNLLTYSQMVQREMKGLSCRYLDFKTQQGGFIEDLLDDFSEERDSLSTTIQKLNSDITSYREQSENLVYLYEGLKNSHKELSVKLEYKEIECCARIAEFEEILAIKENTLSAYEVEKTLKTQEIISCRLRISSLESSEQINQSAIRNLREFQKASTIAYTVKPQEVVKNLNIKLQNIEIQTPPLLAVICKDMKGPIYANHSIIVKNFKVDYLEGLILGYDDIKTQVQKNEICQECGKPIPYDPVKGWRYHQGVLSTLGGIPKKVGYFHTGCVFALKFITLNFRTQVRNEQ